MKFCPIVPEICRGQVHVLKKERRKRIKRRIRIIIIIIIIIIILIRNGAKTKSLPNFVVWET
jgi:accessory gene regulator protein AgrB